MAGYRSVPVIVRPSDLRARTVPADVAQAVRSGRARFVGFEGQGDPKALLAAREMTKAVAGGDHRRVSERALRIAYDEVDEDAWQPATGTVGGDWKAAREAAYRDPTLRTFEVGGETVLGHRQPRPRARGVGVTGPSRRGA